MEGKRKGGKTKKKEQRVDGGVHERTNSSESFYLFIREAVRPSF
jgi:hypothetical protein